MDATQANERTQRSISQLEEQQLGHEVAAMSERTRKRRLVLFFGRATFSDNTKYLYLKALSQERHYEVRWCSFDDALIAMLQSQGLPCMHMARNIDLTIDALMHCAVAVFCVNPNESLKGSYSLNGCLAGAKKLQLWHGVSVKQLLLQLVPHLGVRELTLRRAFYMASRADHVLSTAKTFDGFWREVFGCRQLVRAGFPRNEVLVRPPTPHELLGSELMPAVEEALSTRRKQVLVVPTWQRGQNTWLTEPDFFTRLLSYGKKNNVNFFLKMHPTYFQQNVDTTRKTDGFYMLSPGVDLYPLMSRFDALLTDYSSIMFDFLLTKKPVLSLDLSQDQHHRFEPNWSLVPDVDFRHKFVPDTLERALTDALRDDTRLPQRSEMVRRIFETAPETASDELLVLIDRLVETAVADDYSVESFGASSA
jgi:CDP-glycerol glycerophosphotransferase